MPVSHGVDEKAEQIIENQEKIIRDLEEQIEHNMKGQFNQVGRMSTSQQSTQIIIQNQQITIQSLEQRIL